MALMNEEDFRALIEQEAQLHALTKHPGWPVLADWLERRMLADKKSILNGLAGTLEDYAARSGRCVGATWALDAHRDVAQLVANERERRAQHQHDDTDAE